MVSKGAVLVLGFCVTLSPMLGIPWLVVLCPLPWRPALVCGFLLKNLLSAARTCGWQPTAAKIRTPWKAFIRSVKYQMYWGPPIAQETTSATQVTPITMTSFMQMRPNVALKQDFDQSCDEEQDRPKEYVSIRAIEPSIGWSQRV